MSVDSHMDSQPRDTMSITDSVEALMSMNRDGDQEDSKSVVEAPVSVSEPRIEVKRSVSCPASLGRTSLEVLADAVDNLVSKVQSDPVEPGPGKTRAKIVPIPKPRGNPFIKTTAQGQREIVTVENAQTLLDPDACLFVANLPASCTDTEIQLVLTQAMAGGKDIYVKVNRGMDDIPYAHVQYHEVTWALKMADEKQHQLIWNRQLRIEPATATRHLFLSFNDLAMGVPTEADIRELLKHFTLELVRKPTAEELLENSVDACTVAHFAKWGECGEALRALKEQEVFAVKTPKKSQKMFPKKTFRNRGPKKPLTVRIPRPEELLAPPPQAAPMQQVVQQQQAGPSYQVPSPYQLAPGQQIAQLNASPYFSSLPGFPPNAPRVPPLLSPFAFGNVMLGTFPIMPPSPGPAPGGFGHAMGPHHNTPLSLWNLGVHPIWMVGPPAPMMGPQSPPLLGGPSGGMPFLFPPVPPFGQPMQAPANFHPMPGTADAMMMGGPASIRPMPGTADPMMVREPPSIRPFPSIADVMMQEPPAIDMHDMPGTFDVMAMTAPANVRAVPEPANVQPVAEPADVQPMPESSNVQPSPGPANVQPTSEEVAGPTERPPKRRRQNHRRMDALPDISTPPS